MEIPKEVLSILEATAKTLIESHSDKLVHLCLEEIKKVIPGEIDDVILDQLEASLKAKIKELLLDQAEKISAE